MAVKKPKKKVNHQSMRTTIADLPGVFASFNRLRSVVPRIETSERMQTEAFWREVWDLD